MLWEILIAAAAFASGYLFGIEREKRRQAFFEHATDNLRRGTRYDPDKMYDQNWKWDETTGKWVEKDLGERRKMINDDLAKWEAERKASIEAMKDSVYAPDRDREASS